MPRRREPGFPHAFGELDELVLAYATTIHKGHGPAHDYLHLHYRNAGVLLAMGMPMVDHMRQLAMTATDPHSRGRNFPGHYARREWNVLPVTSVIELRHTVAPGCALVQKRLGVLEARLQTRDYLEDRFTAGDLLMTTVLRFLRHTELVSSRPALKAYQARCEARPAFQKALAAHMRPLAEAATVFP